MSSHIADYTYNDAVPEIKLRRAEVRKNFMLERLRNITKGSVRSYSLIHEFISANEF